MTNLKKLDFYNVITGEKEDFNTYGIKASTFKKLDNIDMVFDSRGEYLGIMTCRGKFVNGKYTSKKGIKDFKTSEDLMLWNNIECVEVVQ